MATLSALGGLVRGPFRMIELHHVELVVCNP